MSKRKKTHEGFEDQYGGFGGQDREEQMGFSKGTLGGGGGAGKSRANNTALNFQRHVPKFLQPYAHMLGQARPSEDEPTVVAQQQQRLEREEEEDDDRAAEEEAIARALEENPELAAQLGPEAMRKVEAAAEKELGNKAFAAKDYEGALQHFTKCIELDPKNAVFYSNRSAAAANLSRFDEALADARRVLKLRPGWVKGHARAAAAYMGLQLFSEAKEEYERAVKLEPDDRSLQASLNKAVALELQHIRDHKHVFKKMRGGGSSSRAQQQGSKAASDAAAGDGKAASDDKAAGSSQAAGDKAAVGGKGSSKHKQKSKLSFAEEEEDEG